MRAVEAVPGGPPPGTIIMPSSDLWRSAEFGVCLMGLKTPDKTQFLCQRGANVAENLNVMLKVFTDPEMRPIMGEWVWIIGDDHTFPEDTIFRLLAHEVDIVAPFCLRRTPPFLPVIAERDETAETKLQIVRMGKVAHGMQPVLAVGTAGMLIRRRVIEAMEPPWFQVGQIRKDQLGEDVNFCLRARELGFDIWVDGTLPIGHVNQHVVKPKWTGTEWVVELELGNHISMAVKVEEIDLPAPPPQEVS